MFTFFEENSDLEATMNKVVKLKKYEERRKAAEK